MNDPPTRSAFVIGERIAWVDTAKGLGIALVVVGHVLRGLVASNVISATPGAVFIDAWIYAFHMPLFFFLSGLFLSRSATKPFLEFARDKVRTIAYPYFVWSLIVLLIKTPLGPIVNQPRNLLQVPDILYHPAEQFWFLYVLFLISLALGILLKLGIKPWAVVLFSVVLSSGIWPLPWSGWVPFELARSNAIYVALGIVVGKNELFRFLFVAEGRALAAASVASFLVVTLFVGFLETNHSPLLGVVVAVSGMAGVVFLAVFINRRKLDSSINFLGRYSLEIFVAHTIASSAIRILMQRVLHIAAPAPYFLFCTIVGLYGPIFIAIVFKHLGFRWAFTIPKRNVIKLKQDEGLGMLG